MNDKEAAEVKDLLRIILGAGLVGASARGAYHLGNNLFGKKTWKEEDDLYDPEVEIPVRMSPAEYQRYQELLAARQKPAKTAASAWDPTLKALAGVGGGLAGWAVASKLIHSLRQRKINKELEQARQELASMADPEEYQLPADPSQEQIKSAAAWDWLDVMAERYTQTVPRLIDEAKQGLTKEAAIGGLLRRLGKTISKHPAESAAVGIGGAAVLGPSIPILGRSIRGIGEAAKDVAGAATSVVGKPVLNTLIATLGPVAALSMLYGLHKGYSRRSKETQRYVDLAALRKKVREQEAKQTPYFRARPVVTEDEPETKPRREPLRLGVNQTYSDADEAAQ